MKKVQLLKITGGGGGLTGHYSYYYRPVGKHERMLENLCQASRHSILLQAVEQLCHGDK